MSLCSFKIANTLSEVLQMVLLLLAFRYLVINVGAMVPPISCPNILVIMHWYVAPTFLSLNGMTFVTENAPRDDEGCFLLVCLIHSYLVVT